MTIEKEYRPELLSRKGEAFAWLSTGLVFIGWLTLTIADKPITKAIPFLGIFLLLSASGISLSNWMDRKTQLIIFPHGIHYENGLRNSSMKWEEIQEIQVFPSNWGKKVRLVGKSSHFDFRTLGEVKVQEEVKGKIGFAEGEWILKHILEKAEMALVDQNGSSYYYARK